MQKRTSEAPINAMKILYLCSLRFDYLQDLTYSGLVKLLGQQNVTDYPWNPKFHLPVKDYPKNLGFTSFTFPFRPNINFSNFDLVIIAAAKQDVLEVYSNILPKISHLPVLFLDGGDLPEIGGDFYRLKAGAAYESILQKRPFDFILKREFMPALHGNNPTVSPFPFSFPYNMKLPVQPEHLKKYDVSFWGQQEPAIRARALRMLQGKYDCEKNGTTLNQDFSTYKRKGKFYLEEIARCKIVLNFRGGGWDTMRYWETPAVGTFMITQKPQITIPHNFEDGKHVVYCDDSLGDLVDKIDYYLQRPEERAQIANNAKEHLEQFHLNTVRAQTLLDIVREKI